MHPQNSIKPVSHNLSYRADIDGLRAVAVSVVVLSHAFPTFIQGGFVGVDIFFVISGFFISKILITGLQNKNFTFGDFYSRRIRCIFPALILVMASSLAFGSFALFPDEFMLLAKHVLGGAGFVSKVMLWYGVGFFDVASESKPLLHLWSLGIEEQFYIFWPIFLALAFHYGGWHRFASSHADQVTPAGTVMLSGVPVLMGIQLVLAFLAYDIASVPRRILHNRRARTGRRA